MLTIAKTVPNKKLSLQSDSRTNLSIGASSSLLVFVLCAYIVLHGYTFNMCILFTLCFEISVNLFASEAFAKALGWFVCDMVYRLVGLLFEQEASWTCTCQVCGLLSLSPGVDPGDGSQGFALVLLFLKSLWVTLMKIQDVCCETHGWLEKGNCYKLITECRVNMV